MAKNIQLLLLESVENLGIVGDVVKVKPGFARNYLLPMGLAEPPSRIRIEALKEARAHAQARLAEQKAQRQKIIAEIDGATVAIERSCNDQGALYGSVTQRDISDALISAGYGVDPRSVRLSHPIRRIGAHHIPIQFDRELRADVTLTVKPDRALEGFDETGQAIATDEAEPAEGEGEGEGEGEATHARERRGARRREREAAAEG